MSAPASDAPASDAQAIGPDLAAVEAGGKQPPANIGDWVFDETRLRSYHFTFSDAEYAKLMDMRTLLTDPMTVNTDRYVQASLRVDDTDVGTIAVRFKGNYSIWGCVDFFTGTRKTRTDPFFGSTDICQRFSFKLDIDRHDADKRLDGLKKLNLHAMAADPSKMRERLGYALFRDMNLLAPRATHAKVYVNGAYHGLFVAVEQVDGRFLAKRFPQGGDGNLYKNLWPTKSLSQTSATDALETNNDPGQLDVSDFLSFRDAVVGSTSDTFSTRLASLLDLDYLARYIVVDRAIANFDGVMAFYGGTNYNYYWYHDEVSGRFLLIPWDFDKVLWFPEPNFWSNNAPAGAHVVPNWNVVTQGCKRYMCDFDFPLGSYPVRAIDCDPFLRMVRDAIYSRQKDIAETLLGGPFSAAAVKTKLDTWKAQISDAQAASPGHDPADWSAALDRLLGDIPKHQQNLRVMMSGTIKE